MILLKFLKVVLAHRDVVPILPQSWFETFFDGVTPSLKNEVVAKSKHILKALLTREVFVAFMASRKSVNGVVLGMFQDE